MLALGPIGESRIGPEAHLIYGQLAICTHFYQIAVRIIEIDRKHRTSRPLLLSGALNDCHVADHQMGSNIRHAQYDVIKDC